MQRHAWYKQVVVIAPIGAVVVLGAACSTVRTETTASVDKANPDGGILIVDESTTKFMNQDASGDLRGFAALERAMQPPTSREIVRQDSSGVETLLDYPGFKDDAPNPNSPIRMKLLMDRGQSGGVRMRLYYLGDDPQVLRRLRQAVRS